MYGHLTATQAQLTEDGKFADANVLRRIGRTPRVRKPKIANSPCLCGCGSTPNKLGSRFMPGHDGRMKGRLLAQAKAGSQEARTLLMSLGWGHFLPDANA